MPNNELATATPTDRTQRIVTLAHNALAEVEAVRTRIRRCTEDALECGRLLIEERAHVVDTLGHGAWGPYFEAHFARAIPERTAQHWMKQAKSAIADIASHSTPNALRNQVLTLGLFPPKQHTVEGSDQGPVSVTVAGRTQDVSSSVTRQAIALPKHSTHLGIINRFSAWANWLRQETKGNITHEQAVQLLKDFEPIEQFIESLRATIQESNQ